MSGRSEKTKLFINVYFPSLVGVSCLLPLTALLFCEAWSVLVTFETSTATKCGHSKTPWNFLPSISEATGRTSPQRYVWRIFIAFHASPRLAIAAGYYKMHWSLFSGNTMASVYMHLSKAAYILHVVEIMSLVGLSFISSTEDYEVHKFCFETFMFTSLVHMIIMCVLFRQGRKAVRYNPSYKMPGLEHTLATMAHWFLGGIAVYAELRSSSIKQILFITNISAFGVALYFFYRHNKYCENGVYSLFAIFEIIVVASNIAFHGTAMIDFSTSNLVLQDMER